MRIWHLRQTADALLLAIVLDRAIWIGELGPAWVESTDCGGIRFNALGWLFLRDLRQGEKTGSAIVIDVGMSDDSGCIAIAFSGWLSHTVRQEVLKRDTLLCRHVFQVKTREWISIYSNVCAPATKIDLGSSKDFIERQLIVVAMLLQTYRWFIRFRDIACGDWAQAFFKWCQAVTLAIETGGCFFDKSITCWINLTWCHSRNYWASRHSLLENRHIVNCFSLSWAELQVILEIVFFLVKKEFLTDRLLCSWYLLLHPDLFFGKWWENMAILTD